MRAFIACSRRLLVLCLVVIGFSSNTSAADWISAEQGKAEENLVWYDVRLADVEGQGWSETKSPFDRLPPKAEGVVRPAVWSLSRHSAGIMVRFRSNSDQIQCRWSLTSARLDMPHMPATGVSGVDLYVRHDGRWRWLACGFPRAQENKATLVSGIDAVERDYLLYLPLYNGASSVEIGVPKSRRVGKSAARKHQRPIVFYGTSITQGGCASRPGMVHTALLGRWLERPIINLGFSGNGRMEQEVAALMAEIDAEVFVIDCLPNISAGDVASRTEPLIKTLREKHPETPIVLVEDRNYTNSYLIKSKQERNASSQAALRKVFERVRKGDNKISYLPGADLLGDDDEGTVDSSHPTDLGFYRQAKAFETHLKTILKD